MSNYEKYKERTPQETVFEIQSLLHKAGLFPVMEWMPTEYQSLQSNRVRLYPSKNIGQNGKGTDELYASASGYAELMERMQNGWLSQKVIDEEQTTQGGFLDFPDEKIMPVADLIAQEDPYLTDIFARLNLTNIWQKIAFLSKFAKKCHGLDDDTIRVIPYVDLFEGKIVYLPFALITLFGISNGMTAGNTIEEALVQGISEIYERHVHFKLLAGKLTPPEIPREELIGYDLSKTIAQIEESGRYSVSVRDCSLGEDYPVSCVIISDKENGTFGVKFGSHPSFAISVERTLTESFQGQNLANFAVTCRVGTDAETSDYHNIPNVGKIGHGYYPASFFASKPSWEYQTWSKWASSSNKEYLKKLLAHAKLHGYRPLVRDSSHLGFPSYHVVIPRIHNIYPVSMIRVREFFSQLDAAQIMNHFPALTDEDEKTLLNYLRFKSLSVESDMGLTLMHDFIGDDFNTDKIGAFLSLKRGEYDWARRFFRKLISRYDGGKRRYYECYETLAKHLQAGLPLDQTRNLIAALFAKDVVDRVSAETADITKILHKIFPQMKCFDCENCALSGVSCECLAANEVRRKIKVAVGKSKVSQEMLRAELKNLLLEGNAK